MPRLPFAALAAALMAATVVALAVADRQAVMVPFEDAKFVPIDPARPEGPQIAVLSGNPDTGPSAMLLKIGKGMGRLHSHSSDYQAMVVQGTAKHWLAGQDENASPPLGPGSYWLQPGDQAHADGCLTDQCVLLVVWQGKRDVTVAD